MKTCSMCGVDKDESLFSKHTSRKDRLQGQCKDCFSSYRIAYYNREEIKHRRIQPAYKAQHVADSIKHKTKHPEQNKARLACKKFKAFTARLHCHHWSYKKENHTSVFVLGQKAHAKAHMELRYIKDKMCFMTNGGVVLDSYSKHRWFLEKNGFKYKTISLKDR